MSKSKSILDFFKVNLESEKVTHDSPEDHDHSEPSVSGLVPPVTGGVASESLVVDDTDLLHEGLDINQHASDECKTPSELPKTLECLPMEEDPSQDALQSPSQDALQVPSQDALQGPSQDALQVPTQDALQDAIRQTRKLNDNEKYELLISEQKGLADADLNTIWFSVEGRKRIQFQSRWLQDYKWLRYGTSQEFQGGWCLPCILFLTESEKSSLGVFVCSPFTNYNKSKELLEKHSKKDFHLRAVDRAYEFKKTWLNPAGRIDMHIMDCSAKNFMLNSKILPLIVEAVLLCARQKMTERSHRTPPTSHVSASSRSAMHNMKIGVTWEGGGGGGGVVVDNSSLLCSRAIHSIARSPTGQNRFCTSCNEK